MLCISILNFVRIFRYSFLIENQHPSLDNFRSIDKFPTVQIFNISTTRIVGQYWSGLAIFFGQRFYEKFIKKFMTYIRAIE